MHILVVTECFWPDIYAVNDIVEKLVQRGHKVTVLTGLPDYTTSEIPEEYQHGRNRRQNYKGAEVYRVSTIPRRHGPIWRSLSYLSFWFNGVHAARHRNWDSFDVIYVWEVSPVTMAFPAIAFKIRFHKPLFLYCMDIWPECVKAMGFKEHTLPYKVITAISKRAYRSCDHIAVSSRPFFDYLSRIDGVSPAKMSYLPQYGPAHMLTQDFTKIEDKDAPKTVDLLFIGNIGKAQGLDVLLRAASKIQTEKEFQVHIAGGGSDFEACMALAKELHLSSGSLQQNNAKASKDRVLFYGPVPFDQSLALYKKSDACVFTLNGDTHIGDTLPGKVQTYMAAGKPILAACNGAGQEVIKESDCGLCVDAGDVDAYAQILTAYIEHPEQYLACGVNSRTYFKENFMEEEHFAELEQQLTNCCRNN